MTNKEAYDKAIEAYQFHINRYNTWMNYYSIFVGVLFVALYSVMDKCDKFDIVKSVITLMGLFASVCWLLSFRGYYSWLISWTNVVQFYEKKITSENNRIYLLINKTLIERYGYSTQKVTLCFIYMVIIAWGTILGWVIFPIKEDRISIIFLIIGGLIVFFTICSEIKPRNSISKLLYSDISKIGFENTPNNNSNTQIHEAGND